MKAACCFVLLIGVGILRLSGASVVWTNIAGGSWHTAENWSPNQVPSGTDDVSITNAGTYAVTLHIPGVARSITLGGAGGVQTLTVPTSLLVISNALTIGSAGVIQAQGTLISGDVIVNGEFQVAPFGLVLAGSGSFSIAGGRLRIPFSFDIANRIVRNSGTVTISDGSNFRLGDNTFFTNDAGATVIFTNNGSAIRYNGNFPNTNQFFANHGIVRVHGNSVIQVPTAHSGTIEVAQGELSLQRHPSYTSFAVDVTAVCNIAPDATLAFENASTEFRPPASASGAGSLRVSGGTFNLTGAYNLGGTLICQNGALVSLNTGSPLTLPHVLNDNGGDLRGSDPLTITGTLVWRNGGRFSGPAPLRLDATAQTTLEFSGTRMTRPFMVNAGTMNWNSGDLRLETNCVFTNLPTGVIVITNAPSLQNTFVTTVGVLEGQAFYNAGTIRLTADSPTECSIPFFNTGTVRIERNEFRLTFNATFEQHAGATELAGGALRFFPGSNYRLFGGVLTGNGSVIGDDVENFGGSINPGTSPGQINFNQSLSLNPAGAMNIELGGPNPGSGFDQVTVGATALLSGGNLNVSLANNFTPTVGMKFPFLTCGTRSGAFQSVNYPSNQVTLQLNYLPNGVELEVLQVAPSLQVSPLNATLRSGETRTFSASGGTPPYSFTLIQNHSGGTIHSSSGFYTAGPNGGFDLVRVTDAASATVQATVVVIPFDLIISDSTPQDFLNFLTAIEGSVIMSNIDARATLLIPGLASVGRDLVVRDNDQLVTLNLGALQTVGGTIDISGNPALTNVALPALTNVAGNVVVKDNASMTSLDLASLTTANGTVSVNDNDSMVSLDLGSLATANGSVSVNDNDSMVSLDLTNLQSVGGDVTVLTNTSASSVSLASLTIIGGSVSIDDNGSLTSIDLGSVTSVGGSVSIDSNASLTSIDLGGATSISGSVDVTGNISATNISLGSLTSSGGSVDVSDNTAATNIDLGSLASAGGSVTVDGNTAATIVDLNSLGTAGGSVSVDGNTAATVVDLGSLQSASGAVSIDGNSAASVIDLGSLTSSGGSVSVDGNTAATVVDLGSLQSAGGAVSIDGNSAASVIDLGSLTSSGGSLSVSHNTSASSIDLASLTTVGGDVSISDNTSASSIDLGSLTTVDGNVSISDNTSASSIDLGSLTSSGGSVSIDGNTSATGIDVASLTTVGGSVSIDGNTSATGISLGSLSTVDGTFSIDGNTSATGINLGSLIGAGGSVSVAGNSAATGIDLRSLASAGGSVDVSGNTSATGIDLGSLRSTGGSIDVSGNTSATGIDLSSLATAGGTVDVSGNTSATGINLGSLTNVIGNLLITSNAPTSTVSFGNLNRIGEGTNTAAIDLRGDTFVFASGLNVPSNVFLRGFGTIVGNLTNAGTIAPGASPGRFNIAGHAALIGSSELRFELGAYTPGTGFDFLSVTGHVTLGGALTVSLINQFEHVVTNGASFTVLTAGSPITGAFANVASGSSLTTTDGYARFTVRYAGEMAVRLTDAVLVDTDNDGMADWWEDQSGFNKTNSADATLDLDGDGASNVNEFRAGTLPDNPASLLRIVSVERAGNDVRVTWTTVGGKSYRMQTSAAVDTPFADFSQLIPAPGSGESTTNLVDAGAATNAAHRYYRVRLEP